MKGLLVTDLETFEIDQFKKKINFDASAKEVHGPDHDKL